jgi:molecular chaperone HtpG
MKPEFQRTPLMLFLKSTDPPLYGKVLEVHDVIQSWLAYIPQTFPHYTRHTLPHSEAIILQVSKLLFRNDDPADPAIKISAMEAYILCAAALLHDAGMVASDQEKAHILESDSWREWTTERSPGAKRWTAIELFRTGMTPADSGLRNFLADVQLRYLIADFVRRSHHLRVQELLGDRQEELGRFAFDDPILLRTVAAVCVAHGLDQRELEDRDRYPDRRDVLGQQVNVRLLAVLLRLGDLLDMSTDRACPLLLNAACPLPADSLAHWTQYRRLTHFLVSADRVEITAKCKNQEEHRLIKDWCSWLVKEATNGTILMARSARHPGWRAPTASMDCSEATIKIEPALDAAYIPSNWRFELDQELVFRRLIDDVYTEPLAFVRELIQNALDATRCEMYLALTAQEIQIPEFPTQAPEGVRKRHAIRLGLEARKLTNPLSGEQEERHVFVIDDPGIGMDREIIERYLLQVGRSYYTTTDFQRKFPFVPTSRFGLGFLSVFAVSDHVTIETFKPTSTSGPLRVVLTGPRNYILLEKGARRKTGTRIEVRLREPMERLTVAVSEWCRRVEFPVVVEEFGIETTVEAERKENFVYEAPDIINEGARFAVRAFDIQRHGLEGELYVFVRVDERGESWDAWSDAYYRYPRSDPRASRPVFPESLTCINGISIARNPGYHPHAARIDFRGGDMPVPNLSRERIRVRRGERGEGGEGDSRITSRWVEIMTAHLSGSERANSAGGWRYKQALIENFPWASFWASVPGTIPIHDTNQRYVVSLDELQKITSFVTIIEPQRSFPPLLLDPLIENLEPLPNPQWSEQIPAIFQDELLALSELHKKQIFSDRKPTSASWLSTGHLVITWTKQKGECTFGGPPYKPTYAAELPDDFTVGFEIHPTTDNTLRSSFFNLKSPFVQWLVRLKVASRDGGPRISPQLYEHLYELFHESCGGFKFDELKAYVEKFSRMAELSDSLRPPELALSRAMFVRAPNPREKAS